VLRSFRVANHRSIRAEQELLLMPAYDKTRPVVPVAALFGANASGKSNLLDALRFMQTAVRRSYADWEPGAGVPRTPFKLDPAAAAEPSSYVVELILDGVRHIYGFEIDEETVREEWLYAYPHNRRRVIFEREGQQIRLGSTIPEHRSRGALLADLTRPNTLFVSAAARLNVAEIMPIYEWFRTGIAVVGPDHQADHETLVERLLPESPVRQAVIGLLRAADPGITDILVHPQYAAIAREMAHALQERADEMKGSYASLAQVRILSNRMRSIPSPLRFIHGENGIPLDLDEQSHGTRAWMIIVDHLLNVLGSGSVLAVDEIDSSLHPRLCARLIEIFQSAETNPRGAQLFVTTHDATMLGPMLGGDVLDRDQIWFVDKGPDRQTTLFALTDFHPRRDEHTERRYLGGSYGAIPTTSQFALQRALEDAGVLPAPRGVPGDGAA
jgi:uncharacterized protein